MKLNPSFYNKKISAKCPKCRAKVSFALKQLGSNVICPGCKSSIYIKDGITEELKKLGLK